MKNLMLTLSLALCWIACMQSLNAQEISNYLFKLGTGETVKVINGWQRVDVSQVFDSLKKGATSNFSCILKNSENIPGKYSLRVFQAGQVKKESFLKPGTYSIRITYIISNQKGIISFDVTPVKIQDRMETHLQIDLLEYGISVIRKPRPSAGSAYYQVSTETGGQQNGVGVYPYFYPVGNHANKVNPVETMGDYYGKMKPGTYDLLSLIELNNTGFTHKIWLENFKISADSSYVIQWDLNAAEIKYVGGNYEVKQMLLYPRGTAKQQAGKAQRKKELEILAIERPSSTTLCPPGIYDVMLDYGFGVKYEWRENIKCKAKEKTEVR